MTTQKNKSIIKALTTITFLLMILVNALANIIPINGVNTGQVSDSFANLFAPAGVTFAIWGLIYILLALYTFYQFIFFGESKDAKKIYLIMKVGIYFSISSIANTIWIFSWHYYNILSSMILMIVILVCLIIIVLEIKKVKLTVRERIFIGLPFSVYFGWITVATIANATTLLVSWNWDGFGISEPIWTAIIIVVGLLISTVTMLENKDITYGLVIIWAYAGILLKHVSQNGFNGQYPLVIKTVSVCILLLVVAEGYIILHNDQKKIRR